MKTEHKITLIVTFIILGGIYLLNIGDWKGFVYTVIGTFITGIVVELTITRRYRKQNREDVDLIDILTKWVDRNKK